jgi:hypothetical protein
MLKKLKGIFQGLVSIALVAQLAGCIFVDHDRRHHDDWHHDHDEHAAIDVNVH